MPEIRPATPADVPAILQFIRELAAYERAPEQVRATEADLLRDGWGLDAYGQPLPGAAAPRFRVLMADWAGEPAGFALFFASYSTWLGHHGIRLEDLYVTTERRGLGLGRALLRALAATSLAEGCGRLEWDVLTWNEPAIAVYRRVGAETMDGWRTMRVSGAALRALAGTDEERDEGAGLGTPLS